VVAAIGELALERTLVLVAHRPALAAMADRTIIVTAPGGVHDE
jgi:ABC-type bacteriocin/lantibiotic exporter with double-glycine peptidase domain